MIPSVRDNQPRPTCDTKGCEKPPVWQMGLKIWAKGYAKSGTPIECEIGLFLCDADARATTVENLLTDKAFAALEAAARFHRKAAPDRASAVVVRLPILNLGDLA